MEFSNWREISLISIDSGRLHVCDPSLFPDGVIVELTAGSYSFQISMTLDERDPRVGRFRVVSPGTASVLGGVLESFSVDFARATAGDADAMLSAAGEIRSIEDLEGWLKAQEGPKPHGFLPWRKHHIVKTPWCATGCGDGNYDVRELLGDGRRVGIEVNFFDGIDS